MVDSPDDLFAEALQFLVDISGEVGELQSKALVVWFPIPQQVLEEVHSPLDVLERREFLLDVQCPMLPLTLGRKVRLGLAVKVT